MAVLTLLLAPACRRAEPGKVDLKRVLETINRLGYRASVPGKR